MFGLIQLTPSFSHIKVRRDASCGIWLMFVVPLLLIRCNEKHFAMELLGPTFLILITVYLLNSNQLLSTTIVVSFIAAILFDLIETIRPALLMIFVSSSMFNLFRVFPATFTVGEVILLSHLLVLSVCSSLIATFIFLVFFLNERYLISFSIPKLFILLILIGTCYLIGLMLQRVLLPGTLSRFVLQFPCFLSVRHLLLFSSWLTLFVASVAITVFYKRRQSRAAGKHYSTIINRQTCLILSETKVNVGDGDVEINGNSNDGSSSRSDPCHSQDTVLQNSARTHKSSCSTTESLQHYHPTAPFWVRKVYHLIASIVFTSGILFAPDFLELASVFMLLLFLLFEWARRRGNDSISKYLTQLVAPFQDSRDSGDLYFTPISLLLGLSIPLWWPDLIGTIRSIDLSELCTKPVHHLPMVWSGVLSVGVGDSVAAVAGQSWGRVRWPGSHRTFVGSFFSWCAQLIVWYAIASYERFAWQQGVIPLTMGVLSEVYLEQNDNIVVPMIVMIYFTCRHS